MRTGNTPDRRYVAAASLICLTAAYLTSCGYVGEPLPPSLRIPAKVTDLRAVEYGDKILVEFTVPAMTTDGVALTHLDAVTLLVGAIYPNFDLAQFVAQRASQIAIPAEKPGPTTQELSARDWVGKEIVLVVQTTGPKGRKSDFSNLKTLRVIEPLAQPPPPNLEAVPGGIQLAWQSPYPQFRVFRRGPNDKEPAVIAATAKPEYRDDTVDVGKKYEYFIQAVQDDATSVISGTREITPKKFPPAVPTGLAAVAGSSSIELTWEPGTGTRTWADISSIAPPAMESSRRSPI